MHPQEISSNFSEINFKGNVCFKIPSNQSLFYIVLKAFLYLAENN